MSALTRLLQAGVLRALPKNLLFPAVAILGGWYGGAKYGAPDQFINTIDGVVEQGEGALNGLLDMANGSEN